MQPAFGFSVRSTISAELEVFLDFVMQTDVRYAQRHGRGNDGFPFELANGIRIPNRHLNLALRCDSNLFEKLANTHIQRVFVHKTLQNDPISEQLSVTIKTLQMSFRRMPESSRNNYYWMPSSDGMTDTKFLQNFIKFSRSHAVG
jgi:hypothetical protein